jgi:hypothetical protein
MSSIDTEQWVKMAALARETAIVGLYDESINHFTLLLSQVQAHLDHLKKTKKWNTETST